MMKHLEEVQEEGDTVIGLRDELLEEAVVGEVQVHLEFTEELGDVGELLEAHLPLARQPGFLRPQLAGLGLALGALGARVQVQLQ